MDQTKKGNKVGLYLLAGLLVLVALAAIFIFAGSNQEEAAPASDEQIAGNDDEQNDDQSSCSAYAQAVGELNTKYRAELNTFYQSARNEAQHPAADQSSQTLATARAGKGLQNYDTELNALRAEYGIVGYSFLDEDNLVGDQQNVDPGDYCQQEAAGSFASDANQLRETFDLNRHSAAIETLNSQHQLAEFVADNQVPASTGPWAPPHPDGSLGEPLINWTKNQRQAVVADADEHRLSDYIAEIDRLANDYDLWVFEALLIDLEVRYHLSPSWLVGDGELIRLSQIYDQDPDITYFTIVHIRGLIAPPPDSSQ